MAPLKTRRRGEAPTLSAAKGAQLAALLARRTALSPSEAALLRAVYRAITTVHYDRVWGVLWRRGARPPALDDLLQEVFLAFFIQARAQGFPESIPDQLETLAAGKASNYRRGQRRDPVGPGVPSSRSETPRSAPEIERVLDRARVMQRLLLSLSPEHRAVVDAIYVRGLSHEAAAVELGIPRTTVTNRLMYAKQALAALAVLLLPPSQRGPL